MRYVAEVTSFTLVYNTWHESMIFFVIFDKSQNMVQIVPTYPYSWNWYTNVAVTTVSVVVLASIVKKIGLASILTVVKSECMIFCLSWPCLLQHLSWKLIRSFQVKLSAHWLRVSPLAMPRLNGRSRDWKNAKKWKCQLISTIMRNTVVLVFVFFNQSFNNKVLQWNLDCFNPQTLIHFSSIYFNKISNFLLKIFFH